LAMKAFAASVEEEEKRVSAAAAGLEPEPLRAEPFEQTMQHKDRK